MIFFFSSRRRHTRYWRDWSSDVCSSDLGIGGKLHIETSLTVERNSVVYGIFFQIFFVAHRPLGIAHGSIVSECVPQFFAYVRSERSEHDGKLLQYLFLAAFQCR